MLSFLHWEFDIFPIFIYFFFFLDFPSAVVSFDTAHKLRQKDFDGIPYLEVTQLI